MTMVRRIFIVLVGLVALLVIFLGSEASAQQTAESDAIVVEGRILRPLASYIIQRANVDFGLEAKKKSFLKKIETSIDEPPFK
jgi:hypothetical protein